MFLIPGYDSSYAEAGQALLCQAVCIFASNWYMLRKGYGARAINVPGPFLVLTDLRHVVQIRKIIGT